MITENEFLLYWLIGITLYLGQIFFADSKEMDAIDGKLFKLGFRPGSGKAFVFIFVLTLFLGLIWPLGLISWVIRKVKAA